VPPDIIVISLDTLRRDEVGIVSGEPAAAPHPRRLAGESVVFEDAWAQVPFTLPSHMSIFTSLYRTCTASSARRRGSPTHPTLPELLRTAGYHTVGVVTNLWMTGEFASHAASTTTSGALRLVYADRVNRRAFELLDGAAMTVGRCSCPALHRPHSDFFNVGQNALPYYAPPEYLAGLDIAQDSREFCDPDGNCATEFLLAADREGRPLDRHRRPHRRPLRRGVSSLDHEVGALIDGLRRRGLWTARWSSSPRTTARSSASTASSSTSAVRREPRVPLLLKLPQESRADAGSPRPWRRSTTCRPCSTPPARPTLLTCRTKPAAAGARRSGGERRRSVATSSTASVTPCAAASGPCSTTSDGRSQLFDRLADPGERIDLADRQPEQVAALRAELLEIIAANHELAAAFTSAPAGADILTDDETEKLRAIGYVE